MECGCKITGTPGLHVMEPCSGHLEWMEALVRGEREECAKLCDAAFNDSRHGLDACDLAGHLANVIRLRNEQ